jgi:hypothetical protein
MEEINSMPQAASHAPAEGLAAVKPKKKGRVKKFLLRSLLVLVVAAGVAQAAYTYSGDNEWKSLGTRKSGVTVYERKVPGSNIKQFKAVWKVKARLSEFVLFAKEEESDLTIGYYDQRQIGNKGEQVEWTAWKQKMPSPLEPREFVIKNEYRQDPKTKTLYYIVTADPTKIPPDDCCVRIDEMTNRWSLTPLKNGEVQVEWFVNMDVGGVLPYFMQNSYQPGGMYYFARKLQGYLDKPKYDKARYAWIDEPAS